MTKILIILLLSFYSILSYCQRGFGVATSYKIPVTIAYWGTSLEFYNLLNGIGIYGGILSFPEFSDAGYYYVPFPEDEIIGSYSGNHKSASFIGLTYNFIDGIYFYAGYSKGYIENWTTYIYYCNDIYYHGIYEVDDYNMDYSHGIDFGISLFFSEWTGLSFGYNTALSCYTFGLSTSFFVD